ncbi:hypothetical protein P280DRAFT_524599 [Massarina eburnea CBS 473.64]|uniref:Uncharacterized protein n=1 Tax=Massarina eburnea CBS 473.64 TaxID=1395130 RepID=A0A6A6SEP0_9PLEO|nr:hypothetical protein P280DRAFT_524599 [Massarina eburnea CBS 473.64]
MSLNGLQTNGLYVILFLNGDPHTPSNFHWGLYLHESVRGGTKYHIKGQGAGWITDHGHTAGVFKSISLIGLFQVAVVPNGLEAYTDQQLRTYDSSLNDLPGITCRVWLLRVLALLQKEVNGSKILKCTDLSALEAEVKAWGNGNAEAALKNQQPRPVGVSKFVSQ